MLISGLPAIPNLGNRNSRWPLPSSSISPLKDFQKVRSRKFLFGILQLSQTLQRFLQFLVKFMGMILGWYSDTPILWEALEIGVPSLGVPINSMLLVLKAQLDQTTMRATTIFWSEFTACQEQKRNVRHLRGIPRIRTGESLWHRRDVVCSPIYKLGY